MIITILIGNNVVNIAAASLATYVSANQFGSTGVGIATGVLTILILIFGEITPKTFANRYASKIALRIARIVEVLQFILYPLVILLDKQTGLMERLVHVKKFEAISEAEIKEMVSFGVEHKVVHSQERLIINRALDFADTSAREIMIPIKKAFLLPASKTIQGVVGDIITHGFSRIPIYEKNKSNIIGIVLVKDILDEINKDHGRKTLNHILIKPFFVEDSIHIHALLKEFKRRSFHLAMVRNAKKHNVVGIVTLEDLLEELVGEIEDESDVRE